MRRMCVVLWLFVCLLVLVNLVGDETCVNIVCRLVGWIVRLASICGSTNVLPGGRTTVEAAFPATTVQQGGINAVQHT